MLLALEYVGLVLRVVALIVAVSDSLHAGEKGGFRVAGENPFTVREAEDTPEFRPKVDIGLGRHILAFTTRGCTSCVQTKGFLTSDAIPAGYRIGNRPTDHVQFIQDDALSDQFNVHLFPAFVLVENGKEIDRVSPVVGDFEPRSFAIQGLRLLSRNTSKSADKPAGRTGICPCGGANTGVCYCIQSGVACKCQVGKGSVWNLDAAGKPTGKTGQYAAPVVTKAPATVPRRGRWQPMRVCGRGGCSYQMQWVND